MSFYQREYNQGFRTDIPSLKDVENLKRTGFSGTEMDYSKYTEILSALGCKPGDSLFDYGCSWGYGSWQLSQAGYNVTALEISVQRCEFARRHLGINAYQNSECVNGPFDVFFSCHVLEHVPSVAQSIEFARRVLKSGGWFVAFTPNGCEEFRKTNPKVWNHLWGLVHPNFLDDKYYHGIFRHDIHLITSSSYDLKSIKEWATENPKEQKSRSLSLNGSELLIVARLMD